MRRIGGISVDGRLTPRDMFEHRTFGIVGSLMSVAASENGVNVLTHLVAFKMDHFWGVITFRHTVSRNPEADSVNDYDNADRSQGGATAFRLLMLLMSAICDANHKPMLWAEFAHNACREDTLQSRGK